MMHVSDQMMDKEMLVKKEWFEFFFNVLVLNIAVYR